MLVWELTSGNGGREPQPQTSAREYLDKSKRKQHTNAREYLENPKENHTQMQENISTNQKNPPTNARQVSRNPKCKKWKLGRVIFIQYQFL